MNQLGRTCKIRVQVKIHFHTNEPWKVLEYAASQGDLHKIIVENMERQANGLDG